MNEELDKLSAGRLKSRRRRGVIPIATLAVVFLILLILAVTGKDYESFRREHGHSHQAPHSGTLVVLGMHSAHLEFVLQEETGVFDMYIWDGHAEHPFVLSQEVVTLQVREGGEQPWNAVILHAVPNEPDPHGMVRASHYQGRIDSLGGRSKFQMRIPDLNIAGTVYSAFDTRFPEGNE